MCTSDSYLHQVWQHPVPTAGEACRFHSGNIVGISPHLDVSDLSADGLDAGDRRALRLPVPGGRAGGHVHQPRHRHQVSLVLEINIFTEVKWFLCISHVMEVK